MPDIPFEISPPSSPKKFEDMCCRIYGVVLGDRHPQINGRSGQAQGGVDVFVDTPEGLIGIQCKKYGNGRITIRDVQNEIGKVDKGSTQIERFIVATTATRDARLQKAVRELSEQRVAEGKCRVHIDFWEDICSYIEHSPLLQNDYAQNAPGALHYRIEEKLDAITAYMADEVRPRRVRIAASQSDGLDAAPAGRPESVGTFLSNQLDSINDLIRTFRFKDAIDNLQRIGSDMRLFDKHQKARWYVQRGICTWHLDSGAAAAKDFIHAGELYPDDEKIIAAKIRGLLFLNHVDEALNEADVALAMFPASVNIWVVRANAQMIKGVPLSLADVPLAMRSDCDVLNLLALSRNQAGDLDGAVGLSAKALAHPKAGFFIRSMALALALEAAAVDSVKVSFGMVSGRASEALKRAVDEFTPRTERLWSVQAPGAVNDVLTNLGHSLILLGMSEEAIVLFEEAKHRGVITPHLMRMALTAYHYLGSFPKIIQCGREWLEELESDTLLMIAATASATGDLQLIESIKSQIETSGDLNSDADDQLRLARWQALWQTERNRQMVIDEVKAIEIGKSRNPFLVCGAARLLFEANETEAADAAVAVALSLVSAESSPSERLLLADLLRRTHRFKQAAGFYEQLAPRGGHSDLHNRLLFCYIRAAQLRMAKDLILSFPSSWTSNEDALELALELGHRTSDWEFMVPLAERHCHMQPEEAGGWVLLLTLALRMRMMARFHDVLRSVPVELSGPPSLLATLAALELRFGEVASGMRRLYAIYRRNIDDANAAFLFFTTLVGERSSWPALEVIPEEVTPGTVVTLKAGANPPITIAVDMDGVLGLPQKRGFVSPDSDIGRLLQGLKVGQSILLPVRFGEGTLYTVESVSNVLLYMSKCAREMFDSTIDASLPIQAISLPQTDEGVDLAQLHALVKTSSERARRIMQAYSDKHLTLGILGKMLGRDVVDVVLGWRTDGPPLFVSAGDGNEAARANELLNSGETSYVIDAATVTELALFDCLGVLASLPNVFVTTKTIEVLENKLAQVKESRESGSAFDDNGTLRLIETTEQMHAENTRFIQGMVDAVHAHCKVRAAYGPNTVPEIFEHLWSVLSEEEYSVLLLAAELRAALLTVDGRLSQLGYLAAGIDRVWPQRVLLHAVQNSALTYTQYSSAIVRMFMCQRSFVLLTKLELVFMCAQGGYMLREGLRRVKEYLSSPLLNPDYGISLALGFIQIQVAQGITFGVMGELVEHLLIGCLRHPKCVSEKVLGRFREFINYVLLRRAYSLSSENYGDGRAAELFSAGTVWFDAVIQRALQFASNNEGEREARLRTLMFTAEPELIYDSSDSIVL